MYKQRNDVKLILNITNWVAACVILVVLAACAGPSARHQAQSRSYPPVTIDPAQRSNVVLTAMGLINTPYRFGGRQPEDGFDCSGLAAYVFGDAVNAKLPHQAASIARMSRPVSRSKLQAGDFVFFNTLKSAYSHMGIYVGNGQFVNAPSSGGKVRIDRLDSPYFARHFESAGTLFAR